MDEIILTANNQLVWREKNPLGEERTTDLLEVRQAYRFLGCSRRQFYRYIVQGRLKPAGKLLKSWLFKKSDVEKFVRPRRGQGALLPKYTRPFFWTYPKGKIDPSGNAEYVVAQILQEGNWKAVRWVWRRYGSDYISKVAQETRWIDKSTKNFWKLLELAPKVPSKTKQFLVSRGKERGARRCKETSIVSDERRSRRPLEIRCRPTRLSAPALS